MDAVSQAGGIGTMCAVSACAGHHTSVRRALEVSSFEFTGETNRDVREMQRALRGKRLGNVVAEATTENLEGAIGTMLAASARTGR